FPCQYLSQSLRYLPRPPPFPTRRSSDLGFDPSEIELATREDLLALLARMQSAGGAALAFEGLQPDAPRAPQTQGAAVALQKAVQDRKSTRLNSSHEGISYAVSCLKKKKQ